MPSFRLYCHSGIKKSCCAICQFSPSISCYQTKYQTFLSTLTKIQIETSSSSSQQAAEFSTTQLNSRHQKPKAETWFPQGKHLLHTKMFLGLDTHYYISLHGHSALEETLFHDNDKDIKSVSVWVLQLAMASWHQSGLQTSDIYADIYRTI